MGTLRQDMLHGVFWSAVEKYSGLVVSIVVSMFLARILSPKEYGVVAIATVAIHFLQMFCTMGIAPAIIQRKDLTDKDINNIFTFSLSVGMVLASLFFFSAKPIADFYKNEQLIPVCRILSIQLLFSAANMVPNALMAKNKRFKDIACRTLFLQLFSGIVSVIAALNGAGVYALLISPVTSAIGIFFWNRRFYKVSIDLHYNIEPIRRIFSFSSYQFLFEFANYFSRNLDKLIIGQFMNMDALGIYEKSYRLMQLPMQNVTSVINPVMQPVLKDLQDDKKELSIKYAKIVRFVATISFQLGIILSTMAYEVIHIFYGGKWDAAIPVFSILALSLPLQMILSTSGSIYMICNNTKMQFWLGMRNTITTVIGFLAAAFIWGTIEAMAWAWTITLVLNFIFTYYLLYRYVLCTSIRPMLLELVRPLIGTTITGTVILALNNVAWESPFVIVLVTKGAVAVLLTIVSIQFLGQYDILKFIHEKILKK